MGLRGKARWLHWAQKLPVHGLFGDFCPVFMLHRVAGDNAPAWGHQPEHLEWCLSYVRAQGYQPMALEELLRLRREGKKLPAKSVVFTIDDGFCDNIVDAGELFARYQIPLTCFVISGFVAEELWPWDDQLSYLFAQCSTLPASLTLPDGSEYALDPQAPSGPQCHALRNQLKRIDQAQLYPWLRALYERWQVSYPEQAPEDYRPASIEQLQHFIAQGHRVCAHTHTHRIMTQLDLATAEWELSQSYTWLKGHLPAVDRGFAYPTGRVGDFAEEHQAALQTLGFSGAVTTVARTHIKSDSLYAIPRFSLPEEPYQFIQYLSYLELFKQRLRGLLGAS